MFICSILCFFFFFWWWSVDTHLPRLPLQGEPEESFVSLCLEDFPTMVPSPVPVCLLGLVITMCCLPLSPRIHMAPDLWCAKMTASGSVFSGFSALYVLTGTWLPIGSGSLCMRYTTSFQDSHGTRFSLASRCSFYARVQRLFCPWCPHWCLTYWKLWASLHSVPAAAFPRWLCCAWQESGVRMPRDPPLFRSQYVVTFTWLSVPFSPLLLCWMLRVLRPSIFSLFACFFLW